MTNYANWYAYYRTRMQMMKTASSIAFANVDNNFRVGYYTINNGAGSQFLNLGDFDGTQKNLWYSKFFSALPFGATPLRSGLANAGKLYAGKISVLNDVAANDPMQYACQQNFTILSTDGYWNDASNPTQLDGTTEIGGQDGSDPRPYYDGGSQTRTVSQTNKSELQLGINTWLVESRTQQQQTSLSRLTQSVVTTDTYPWTTQTSTLQTQTTPLNKTDYSLVQSSYALTSVTKQLQESTFKLNSTPRILQSYTYNLTQTTTPLQDKQFNITSVTTPLQDKQFNITSVTTPLQDKQFNITSVTTPLQDKQFNITSVTTPLQDNQFNITSVTTPLQSSTTLLQSSTRQLQQRNQYSTDGGDTWPSTGWVNVSSCAVRAVGPGWVKNTECRYNTAVVADNLSACSTVAASVSPNYTVAQAVTCAYETTPVVATASSCTTAAQSGSSPYLPAVSCAYSGTPVTLTNETSCTAVAASGSSPYSGPMRTCTFNATAASTTVVASCTAVTPAYAATPQHTCTYNGTPVTLSNETTCTAVAASGGNPYTGPMRTCTFNAAPATTTDVTTCTSVTPANAATPKHTCTYTETPVTLSNEVTCTAVAASGGNPYTGPMRTCTFNAAPATTTDVTTCTSVTPANAATPKHTCTYTGTATTLNNETTCTAVAASGSNPYSGPMRTCTFNAAAATTTDVTSCTAVTPANAATPKHTCTYTGTPVTLTNEVTCTVVAASGGNPYSGPMRTCTFNAAVASTTNVTTCTAVTPANAATPKHTCTYTGTPAVVSNLTTCTAVAPSGGNPYTGPSVACAYMAAVTATNLTSCTAGTPSAGPVFVTYNTCGYINGTTTTGLSSCSYIADSTGPVYSGPANACTYSVSATVVNVTTCTPVAQSPTFAAPQKTCAYEAVGTPATNLSTCTALAQSGSAPYAGPNVSCAYSATSALSYPGSCTVNIETGPSYSAGAKISCGYAAGVVTSNVATCTAQAKQLLTASGTVYAPATDCTYGALTPWASAGVACVPLAQSTSSPYVGPARGCQYTAWSVNTYAGTCVAAAQNNTNLTARNCVATPFPVLISTVATTVDSCSTDPTSGVSPVDPAATRSTATSCTYQAPSAASNVATCTPHAADASSPYATAVTCPVSDTGYLAVAPSCTATAPPATFDDTGKIVQCRTTDTTPYTVDYPSGAVPVATCTAGTDPASKVQTACTTLLSTGPTPVDPTTCVTTAPAAPSYVATTCTTSVTTSSVMGCAAPAPTSPLWQTVTCVDNGTGTSNTLADVAAYYYKTDLRTPALNNCTGAIVAPATVASVLCSATDPMNIVRTSPSDPNPAQHMTTFTLGLGASGYMQYSNTYTTDTTGDFPTVKGVSPYQPINGITANPGAGICSWQSTGLCNWPFPTSDSQNTVDDLWHAAVNGRGMYYSAGDPASLAAGISSALNGVAGSGGSAAAPSVSTANLNQSDNYVFSSSYVTSDWTGDLVRSRLNPYTGIPLSTIDWSAQGKLDADTTRNIYAFDASAASKLKAFTSANFAANANFNMPNISTSPVGLTQFLCASPDVCLSAGDQANASGANLVNYLRGDRSNEGIETDNSKYYRQRQHVLGDMVNAQTVYVNHPARDFIDPGYSAFRSTQASRQAVVYAGANDGMLHAFAAKGTAATEALVDAYAAAAAASAANAADAGLLTAANSAAAIAAAALAADPTIGQELWAYIPTMVLPNLYKLADKEYRNNHRYFVDATPVVGDVCVSNCSNAAAAVWKTILVGGLGHGGRGFYAIDITNPASPAALWEFTDANLGYSYGNPQLAKLSDGTWVVMLTSGYNNGSGDGGTGDGVGRLYVLNAATGAQITGLSPISTGYGDPDDPSGLVNISAMVVDPQTDATTVAVYGGDLAGNLWRFDINDTVGPAGVEAQLLAVLEDAVGRRQPITTKPAVSIVSNQKVVYVGTGRFLDASDSIDTSQQSLYAIKDPWTTGGSAAMAIFTNPGGDRTASVRDAAGFVPQFLSWSACPAGSSASICAPGTQVMGPTGGIVNPVDFVADNGWFIDLINSSERANTNPALGLGLLAFVTNAPSLLACDIGGKSYLYFLNYLNGGPIVSP